MVIVGGMGTLIGPVWGAILLTVLPEVLRGFGDLRLVVYGAALTLVVLFMPGGIAQAARVIAAIEARPGGGWRMTQRAYAATGRDGAASLLQAKGLHKSFGGVQAVSDISFDIPAGGVFAIIGPNGAGKSTLLNLMSGVYQPDSGTMTFDGIDLVGHAGAPAGAARHCADVPEDPPVQAAAACSTM